MASSSQHSFFKDYFKYTSGTECSLLLHRWGAIAAIAAATGRRCYVNYGPFRTNLNIYALVVGETATRKTTAITRMSSLLRDIEYGMQLASDSTTREQFFLDLAASSGASDATVSQLRMGLMTPEEVSKFSSEMLIEADDFLSFAGQGANAFCRSLAVLWDHKGVFDYRAKSSKISIFNPCVSIFAGTTPESFKDGFGEGIVDPGFISRCILIHAAPVSTKIAWPTAHDKDIAKSLVDRLRSIRKLEGEITIADPARRAFEEVYQSWKPVEDARLRGYSGMRHMQLIKVAGLLALSELRLEISYDDILLANTVLTYTEAFMARALGEFGDSKTSSVSHKIVSYLAYKGRPVDLNELFRAVSTEVESANKLLDIVTSLVRADKVAAIASGGYTARLRGRGTLDVKGIHSDLNLLAEFRGKH